MGNRLKLLSVAPLVVLAGCISSAADGGAGSAGGAESVSLITDAFGSAEAEQTGGDNFPQAQRRTVIRNGQIELTVDEFNESCDTVESTVEFCGGYVDDSNEYVNHWSDGTYRSGQLVARIPSESFSALIIDMRVLGEVECVEMNSENVTNQLVDIEARLSNLRAQRDHLRDLYEPVNTTENAFAAEERLMGVQTEIERLEARKQSLEDRVALPTVRVSLLERPPGLAQWYSTSVL